MNTPKGMTAKLNCDMSDYSFDRIISRRGSGSYKWDSLQPDGMLPMWVADMDFAVAPCIQKALEQRVNHGIFGYTQVGDAYYDAIISWFAGRHSWKINRDWIVYTSGVVPAVSCCLKALCLPGDNVLVQTPVYNCFFSSIRNQGLQILESPLQRRGDSYYIDFEDFEAKCALEKTSVFLLCNPHNPGGRVWTRDELQRMAEICLRHNVKIVADEIHCEIIMPGHEYTPLASLSPEIPTQCVALSSPSKAFNTAGLQIANIVCANPEWRARINRIINIFEVCDVNPFGPVALQAAYSPEGAEWLAALNRYIFENYLCLKEFLASRLPQVKPMALEGTYLAWLDITQLGKTSAEVEQLLLEKGRIFLSCGTEYGEHAGEGYVRLNLACPRATLREGLERMCKALAE